MTIRYDSRSDRGYADLRAGLSSIRLLWMFALRDIRARYRRSTLGPFWITVSMMATVLGMSFVFSSLLAQSYADYIAYLAIGLPLWAMYSGMVGEGSSALIHSSSETKFSTLPLSGYIIRHHLRQLIFFAHNILPGLAIAAFAGKATITGFVLFLLGLTLAFVAVGWIGFIAALISARFRDVPQIAVNVMQVFFFLTPIIWPAEALSHKPLIIDANPFYYLVAIVRGPILGTPPPFYVWLVAAAIGVFGWLLAAAVYERLFDRLTKWL